MSSLLDTWSHKSCYPALQKKETSTAKAGHPCNLIGFTPVLDHVETEGQEETVEKADLIFIYLFFLCFLSDGMVAVVEGAVEILLQHQVYILW